MKKNWLILLLSGILFNSLQAQTADFIFNSPGGVYCDPYTITVTQTCTGNPAGFFWNFGNGERGSNNTEKITYSTAGTYNVTLTAVYANTAVSKTKTIIINHTPTILLGAGKNFLCKPDLVHFSARGSALITNYEWNFGDGSPAEKTITDTIAHNYPDYGVFTASVKAITADGCSNVSNYDIQVSRFGITGTVATDSACIPAPAVFIVLSNLPPGDSPLKYSWDFGDHSPVKNVTDSNITHVYNVTDSIDTATVVITSVQGCTNQFYFPSFAFGTPPLNTIAKTGLLRDSFCASENIKFTCTATNANKYKWEFGDSTEATIPDTLITHQYRSLGNKRIIVTPFFNGCAGTKDTLDIFIKGVVAGFTFTNSCGTKRNYQFTNSSLGNITHFEWRFSDDPGLKDSLTFNTTHNFPGWGSFKAALLLADSTTGCTDESGKGIYTAVPLLGSNINSVCKDSLISYSVTNSYADTAGYTYDFFVNGSLVSNGADSVLNYYPANHGSFTDYVVIKDGAAGTCDDTLQLNNNTIVKGPVANFISPARMCIDQEFHFSDHSYSFYKTDIISKWEWDFDDGKKDFTSDPPPHKYLLPGFHTVTLKVTDINGCAQLHGKITRSAPLPRVFAFPAMDTICQAKDTAVLTGYTIDTLLWLSPNSISCNSCDTVNVYPPFTTSYIAQATSRFGCRSYDTIIIKVYGPLNLKVFPTDTTVCPGLPVTYNLNTDGITSWSPTTHLNTGRIKNPVANTFENINYTVVVKDAAGCYADTAVARINLFSLPTVNTGDDKALPYNTPFSIAPVYSHDVVSYRWEPSANLTCTNCPLASGIALKTATYTVIATSADGCKASDTITIFVACEKSNLLLPTAFTPNGNGLNEYFYPIARGYRTIRRFVIFNRSGNKVFERKNFAPNIPSLGWDGIIKGAPNVSATETFAWYAETECDKGEVITSNGMVVLIR